MSEDHRVLNTLAQPVHLTLTKTSKGTYTWEVSVHAETLEKATSLIDQADAHLASRYGVKI